MTWRRDQKLQEMKECKISLGWDEDWESLKDLISLPILSPTSRHSRFRSLHFFTQIEWLNEKYTLSLALKCLLSSLARDWCCCSGTWIPTSPILVMKWRFAIIFSTSWSFYWFKGKKIFCSPTTCCFAKHFMLIMNNHSSFIPSVLSNPWFLLYISTWAQLDCLTDSLI